MEDYEKLYKNSLGRGRIFRDHLLETGDKGIAREIEYIFPALADSKDERVRRNIIAALKGEGYYDCDLTNECIAWVEKQKDISSAEYVFRPLAGCDIESAAAQAVEQQRLGYNIVLAFNGAYIPVEEKTANEIVKEYYSWIEKQGKHQQLYIRFGDIPSNEKSKIYRGEKEIGTENGVSVYPAFKSTNGDIVLGLNLPITKTTLHTQQHLLEYDNRPCYLVTGDYVGKDTDGQILISNVNIIEKIDNYRVKTEKQGDTTSDTRYEVKAGGSLSVSASDYKYATITQKDFACDAEEASYTAEVATGDGSIKTVVSKKVSLPNPQSKKWSEEDEEMTEDLIKGCISAEKAHHFVHTSKEIADWLKSLKDRIGG